MGLMATAFIGEARDLLTAILAELKAMRAELEKAREQQETIARNKAMHS